MSYKIRLNSSSGIKFERLSEFRFSAKHKSYYIWFSPVLMFSISNDFKLKIEKIDKVILFILVHSGIPTIVYLLFNLLTNSNFGLEILARLIGVTFIFILLLCYGIIEIMKLRIIRELKKQNNLPTKAKPTFG